MIDWESLCNEPVKVPLIGFTIWAHVDEDGNVTFPGRNV